MFFFVFFVGSLVCFIVMFLCFYLMLLVDFVVLFSFLFFLGGDLLGVLRLRKPL